MGESGICCVLAGDVFPREIAGRVRRDVMAAGHVHLNPKKAKARAIQTLAGRIGFASLGNRRLGFDFGGFQPECLWRNI